MPAFGKWDCEGEGGVESAGFKLADECLGDCAGTAVRFMLETGKVLSDMALGAEIG